MNLPVYQHLNIKSPSLEDLIPLLRPDMNLKHPVVMNVKTLEFDQQREMIGLIENYFVSNNLSYKFPYPVYILSDHEQSVTKVSLVQQPKHLPKFFSQRESKMNVKETHLAGKNKLLQQEVKNSDASANESQIQNYAEAHRIVYELEQERIFYRSIINRLIKVTKNG